VLRDGHLTVDVWRLPEATDVDLVAEVSNNLKDWTAAPEWVERIFPADLEGRSDVVSFRAVPGIADARQLFLNVRVVLRP
jgi:hypothetical protein